MAHEIAGITQCSLCDKSFVGPAIIVGQPPRGRGAVYMQKLAQHVIDEHPKENKDLEWKSLEFLGLLRMRAMRTTDAGLGRMIDELRWQTLQQVLNAHITDATIETQTKNLAGDIVDMMIAREAALDPQHTSREAMQEVLEAEIATKLQEVFTVLRNALEEPGKYPLTFHPDHTSSRIITV